MRQYALSSLLFAAALIFGASAHAGTLQTATFAADAFIAADSQGDFEESLNGCRHRTSTDVARMAQDLQLPSGTVLQTLRLYFVEGTSGAPGIELSLVHNPFDGLPVALGSLAANASGTTMVEVALAHTVDPDGGALALIAELSGTGFFCAAQLEFILPAAIEQARVLSADARAFQPNRDFTSWTEMGQGCTRFNSSAPPIAAYALHLPDGARIEELEIFYFDQNASVLGELLVRLIRRSRTELVPETLATVTSSTNDGLGMASVSLDHTVDSAAEALYLDWSQALSSSTLGLCGVRVRYSSTSAPVPAGGTLHIAGAALVARDSETRFQPNNGCLDQLTAGRPIFHPFARDVQLPQGAPVTRIGISFIDNDPGEDLSVRVLVFDTDYTLFNADLVAEVSSTGADPNLRQATALPPFPFNVDRLESLVLYARPTEGAASTNLLLCNVFVDFGPDVLFADGFEEGP